ncbi:hypothetical protein CI109_107147 [Kwoniella shandongensis]|uniref:Uncharacterized protein n=1 Tax=Kwoniella shandongensis TaxID=1734106 RepID=A0A5M6C7A8_9TREE|nr:uncharacterized protein CI109_002430 [Kwoniella shandongensis]KAA5529089.1 hypothetical protein CI109_002430 [Kwoniella shandongensis]
MTKDPNVVQGFKGFTIAMVQVGSITADKQSNLEHTAEKIREAAKGSLAYPKIDIIMLPEIFNSPMSCSAHRANAEVVPEIPQGSTISPKELPSIKHSPTLHMLSGAAIETGCWIIGGSIPECAEGQNEDDERTWNCLTAWNSEGHLVAKYRKIHMYDVDIPGGITVKESSTITPGRDPLILKTPFGTIGLAICYDIRFPSLLAAMIEKDKDICAYLLPSAFNCVTGPFAWEVLQKVRAIDNQIFVGMCSPARNDDNEYVSYGHSLVCAPNGTIISTPTPEDESECIVFARLEPESMRTCRRWLPVWQSQRNDVYTTPSLLAQHNKAL